MQLKEPFAARQEDNPEEFVTFLGESHGIHFEKSYCSTRWGRGFLDLGQKSKKTMYFYGMGRNASPGLKTLIFDLTAAV